MVGSRSVVGVGASTAGTSAGAGASCSLRRIGASGAGRGDAFRFEIMTGILPAGAGRFLGGSGIGGGSAFDRFGFVLLPARYVFTLVTSSSVRLASAEPFPGIPAFVQISTSSLLSSFSSLASAYIRTDKTPSPFGFSLRDDPISSGRFLGG